MTTRLQFLDKFKVTAVLESLRGDATIQQIAVKHPIIHPTQVTSWKRQVVDGITGIFSDKVNKAKNNVAEAI